MNADFKKVLLQAQTYRLAMSKFLREIIAIPSESTRESEVIRRIGREMDAAGFDRVETDGMGNLLGYIGSGRHLIAMDAHIDTVGVGNPADWAHDPFQGYEDEKVIVGRGASDQKGGLAALIYGGRIIKDLGLMGDYTLLVTATVQEEDCDGLCWQYIVEKGGIRPEFVVSTEPTACNIHRGQRGRMEILVQTRGVSCHGSAPERGENAIFKMAPILTELQSLHSRLKDHPFLGKGSLTVSEISSSSPSRCAVADGCVISIDRRLTLGETPDDALEEIRRLPAVQKAGARVDLYDYDRPAYTGLVYPTPCYFPAWVLEEDHAVCRCLMEGYQRLFGRQPKVDKWTFSTNGVAIMGRYGIPCIGFGPGHEDQAHAPNEKTWKDELVTAAAMYAVIPGLYVSQFV